MIINIDDRQIFVQGSINSAFKTWLCKEKSITWSWILPETQTFPQQITKFPLFCDTRSSFTVFTAPHNLSPYLSKWLQSKTSNPVSPSSTLILFSYLYQFPAIGSFFRIFQEKLCTFYIWMSIELQERFCCTYELS